jgi:hypothetical protein
MLLRAEEIKNSSIEKRKEKKNEEEYTLGCLPTFFICSFSLPG